MAGRWQAAGVRMDWGALRPRSQAVGSEGVSMVAAGLCRGPAKDRPAFPARRGQGPRPATLAVLGPQPWRVGDGVALCGSAMPRAPAPGPT